MKLSAKNTARLAVTAGLCASLTLGGLPAGAIAAELDVVEQGAGSEEIVEQDLVAGDDATADGQGATTPAGPTEDELTTEGEEAPVAGDELDDEVLAGDPEGDDVDAADAGAVAAAMAHDADEPAPAEDAAERAVKLAGNGTAQDPFVVATVDDLKALAKSVNEGTTYKGQLIKVADGATFDLSAEAWSPIGTEEHKFMGTFDGNGVTIKGLRDSADHAVFGLFGYVDGAQLKNVTFTDINLTATPALDEDEKSFKGALVGIAFGATFIDNVTVANGKVVGSGAAGAIAGAPSLGTDDEATFSMSNCENGATVTGMGYLGGIVGMAQPIHPTESKVRIENCKNTGSIDNNVDGENKIAGGIAGLAHYSWISHCSNSGSVKSLGYAGGIVGSLGINSMFENCANAGNIDAKRCAGGILGLSLAGGYSFSGCANTGNISAGPDPDVSWMNFGGPKAGGITGGSNGAGDTYVNCYNGGAITVTGKDATAGGIFGHYTVKPVTACFNEGVLTAPEDGKTFQIGQSKSGDMVTGGATIVDCFYKDGEEYVESSAGGGGAGDTTYTDRGDLVDALNTAGKVPGFWQAQNGSVQPDALIPGIWDGDEEAVVVKTYDASGSHRESYPSLEAAVAGVKNGETIKLVKDVALDATLKIATGKNITLDLNGTKLSNSEKFAKGPLVTVASGVELTLTDSADKNGSITGIANATMFIVETGAAVTTKDVDIVFADNDHSASNAALKNMGTLTIDEGTKVISTEGGVWAAAEKSVTTVNAGEVTAKYYALTGNGTVNGTTVTVNGGKLVAEAGAGIYHPQDGTLTLNGGEITGLTGVQMCAGDLVVPKGSTVKVTATGEDNRTGKTEGDGNIDDGAAISLINRNYPGGAPSADIKGGEFASQKGESVLAYTWNSSTKKYSEWTEAPEHIEIAGGTFNKEIPEAYLAEGFGLNKLPGGGYGVHEHEMVMKSNENGHWTECSAEGCAEKTDVVKHDKGELKGAKDATCTKDGYTGDLTCTECGYVIKKGEAIKALGHTAEKWTSNSTNHWKKCETCGEAFDVAPHEFGDWKVTEEPTATEKGEREHTCKVCGKTVSEEIPALGEKPADKPGDKGDKPGLPGAGDASLLGVAATGIAGALAAAAGAITRRRRK